MSTLEPTQEQLDALERLLDDIARAALPGDAVQAWNLIRDPILEAAAKECEDGAPAPPWPQCGCASAIRAMKGTP